MNDTLGWKQKGKHKDHKESSSERMRCQIGQNGETVEGFQKVEEESKTTCSLPERPRKCHKRSLRGHGLAERVLEEGEERIEEDL